MSPKIYLHKYLLTFILGGLVVASCNETPKTKDKLVSPPIVKTDIKHYNTPKKVNPKNEVDTPMSDTVKSFLYWFKNNEKQLDQFTCINGGPFSTGTAKTSFYVDFNEVKKEVELLKSSNLFTEQFIQNYELRYKKGSEYFKKHPQFDGPPENFDYEYFFLTQDDYSPDLEAIEKIRFSTKIIDEHTVKVFFHLENCGMNLKHTLIKNTQWQIDKIENDL